MRQTARVVVVGGGCVGVNVLYSLAKRGWVDSLLIEGNTLGGASTRHAAGFMPTYARDRTVSRLLNRTAEIYAQVEAETGTSVGIRRNGQMRIARTPGRLDEYRRYMDAAEAMGARAELLSPAAVAELWPLLRDTAGILGALHHPDDAMVGANDVTMALAKGARDRGATIVEHTRVISFTRTPDGEWRVETTAGPVTCEHLVLASGNHAQQTGALLGLEIPAVPIVVQYWITDAVPEIAARRRSNRPEYPIVRDEAYLGYFREEGEGLLFGTYERPEHLQVYDVDAAPALYDGTPLPPDLDAHAWALEQAVDLVPAFGRAGLRRNVRGPMQMTPDGNPLVGPAWGLRNVWLAEGVPGGVLWGGAIGDVLSEWMIEGETADDLTSIDARRFGDYATRAWTRAKVLETWGTHSDTHMAAEERPAARPAKTSPCHDLLDAQGASWVMREGWEVAVVFGSPATQGAGACGTADEVDALVGAAGLADTGPMAKFEVSGAGAAAFLDGYFDTPLPDTGQVRRETRYNARGGAVTAVVMARLDTDRFLLTLPAASHRREFDNLWRAVQGPGVELTDVTAHWGCFTLAGPQAPIILAGLSATLAAQPLPAGGIAVVGLGLADAVRVLRTDLLDDPTFEIHHPLPYQRHLLQALLAAGAGRGLRLVGADALAAVRLGRSIPVPGLDDGPEIAIRGHTCRRAGAAADPALERVTIEIDRDGPCAIGLEGVYHDGQLVGWITSAGLAYAPERHLAIALLRPDMAAAGQDLSVPILQKSRQARVHNSGNGR